MVRQPPGSTDTQSELSCSGPMPLTKLGASSPHAGCIASSRLSTRALLRRDSACSTVPLQRAPMGGRGCACGAPTRASRPSLWHQPKTVQCATSVRPCVQACAHTRRRSKTRPRASDLLPHSFLRPAPPRRRPHPRVSRPGDAAGHTGCAAFWLV